MKETATATRKIWRESSHNKGGEDPYKLVSRLGMIINEMGETLAFNCKSGKDRSGQLDAELKYLTALNAAEGHLPAPGASVTPRLRQMRSDFSLNSGNLEMQRMNTGLPGFKQDGKAVPDLANFIDPKMYSEPPGSNVGNKITYLKKISNTCPEQCAVFAADYFNLECKFKDYEDTHKGQIDITAPLGLLAPPETNGDIPRSFYGGKTEEPCLNHLLKLDRSAIYVMRTGTNGGAGRDRMVKEHAAWGPANGQSSIFTVQVTETSASALIDFIKDCRNEGETMKYGDEIATKNLFTNYAKYL